MRPPAIEMPPGESAAFRTSPVTSISLSFSALDAVERLLRSRQTKPPARRDDDLLRLVFRSLGHHEVAALRAPRQRHLFGVGRHRAFLGAHRGRRREGEPEGDDRRSRLGDQAKP